MNDPLQLSKRERQIMEVIYRLGEATALAVLAEMADAPSRTSVRTILRILENKGHLVHRVVGKEFVYKPTRPQRQVARSALRRVLETFFGGSLERAVVAHLADPKSGLAGDERARLRAMIDEAKNTHQGE